MKIVVTGTDGFIGWHMAEFLEKKGHEVTKVTMSMADLRDYESVIKLFRGADHVYHFAANMGGVGFFSKNNYYPFIDNMTIDLNVLKACEEGLVKRLFYASSACAYPIDGQHDTTNIPSLSEDMLIPANADQMYGWEKLMMILLAKHSPLDVRVGIFNTIFGERQEWQGERAKFPPTITHKVIRSKETGEPIRIWGDGSQVRTFLYIEDAVEKVFEIMNTEGYWGEVNVASDEQVTVKQCADWLCEIAGIEPHYLFEADKPVGVNARGIDNSKFYSHYKYRNKFTTKQGFEKLYQWMLKQAYAQN